MGDITKLVAKLTELEKKTSFERGPYTFFALFKNDEQAGKWNMWVNASWIVKNRQAAVNYLNQHLSMALTDEDNEQIAGVYFIENEASKAAFAPFQQMFAVEHAAVEVKNSVFGNMKVNHAFIITCSTKTFYPHAN